jgi:hypothetical protein
MRVRWEGNARGLLAINMKRQGVEEEDAMLNDEMLFKEA